MNKKKGATEKGASGHLITLHRRLYRALELGFKHPYNKERKWWSNDVEIQKLAVRSISAFLDGISSETTQLPLVKEEGEIILIQGENAMTSYTASINDSISPYLWSWHLIDDHLTRRIFVLVLLLQDSVPDIARALEGILQLKNRALLSTTSAVAAKLVSIIPSSILQPHVYLIHPLASLLSFHQSQVAINCATALKFVVSNLSAKYERRVWEIMRETDAVSQIISKLQCFPDEAKTDECVLEMASLLSAILHRWPSSRYPVWSNDDLMKALKTFCLKPDSSYKVAMLKLLYALALCGYGAKKLLHDENYLLEVIVDCTGKPYPHFVRVQAFRVLRTLLVTEEGCSKIMSLYCEAITKSIINGITGWKLGSGKITSDETSLLIESCQSLAVITRQPGKHHDLLWNLGIDKVLLDLTVNSQSKNMLRESLSLEEMIRVTQEDLGTSFIPVLRPYIWDILGWLVALCDADSIPDKLGSKLHLKILITMTCLSFVESIGRKCQAFQADPANINWIVAAAKATLMMIYSPCKCVASHARSVLAKVLQHDEGDCLKFLLRSVNFSSSGDNLLTANRFQIVVNMIGVACYSGMPQFFKNVIASGGTKILLDFIRRWSDNSVQCQRISLAPNLHGMKDERACCIGNNEEWEGTDAPLLLSLWSLSELFKLSSSEGIEMDIFSGQTAYNKDQLINELQGISLSTTSSGLRWHASYFLSFLGLYGFTSKLGKRMAAAFSDKESADVKMLLKSGEWFVVHAVFLLVRCPLLMPPQTVSDEEKRHDHAPGRQVTAGSSTVQREVTLSAQVDHQALEKLLDFIYLGFVEIEEELLRKLKIIARHCNLQPLLQLLTRRRPKWGDPFPNFDLTLALRPSGVDFSDVVLQAKSTRREDQKCSLCALSSPHIHAHKIILLSSCDYMRALIQSGMQESHSQTLHVPISLEALDKLAIWFYSGELPRPMNPGCLWDNMNIEEKLAELQPYVELCWLGEFWMLDEVREECSRILTFYLDKSVDLAVKILQSCADFSQWELVEFAANVAGPHYPSLRESGALDCLDEGLADIVRTASVRISQN